MKKNLLILFLLISCCAMQVMAQTTVKGKVTNEKDGTPIPGVTIKVKNSAIIAISNADGTYSIRANNGQVLVFSFIGYVSKDVTVGTAGTYNVTLAESEGTALTEVVVTAYGIERNKPSLGYSTPTVKGDEVSETQREDFFGGLQGRVPGLSINSTSGNPGASAQIVLRGFTSISGDNNALIVVDGVPVNNTTLNQTSQLVSGAANRDQDYSNRAMDINPYDIESYTIMKGPEATALYGSAGAGGAILITTKKGKAGVASITYTTSERLERLNKFPQFQTVYNSGTSGVFASSTVFGGPRFLPGTQIYDNINEFYQTAFTSKQNVAIEGGTDKYTYRWSNEYSNQNGVVPTSAYKRFSSRITASAVVTPWLKITNTFAYTNAVNNKVNKGPNGILMQLARFNPSFDIRQYQNPDGTRLLHYSSIFSEYDNPLWDVNKDPAVDKTDRILGNVNIQLKPTKWVTVTGIFGADIASTAGIQVYNGQSYKGSGSASAPTGGYILNYQKFDKLYNGSLTASAKSKFGANFSGQYVIGGSFNDFNSNTQSQSGTNFYDPNFYSINNTLPTTRNAYNSIIRFRNVGAFAQTIFGYKALLYLTLTGRVDGTSRLFPSLNANTGTTAEAHPYFAYPSASMAFNFSEIKKVKDALPWLDNAKLRASYALTGKEPYREYALGTNYVSASTTGGGYYLSVNAGNATLKPETSKNFETGIEAQMFNGRLGVDFNFFNLTSADQIINPRLSYASGFVLELLNGGTVRNRGFEAQITGTPIRSKNFSWDLSLTYTQYKGTVVSIANQLPELYDSDTWVVGNLRSAASPGASTGNVTGTRFDRNKAGQILISPTTGMPTVSDATFYPIGDRIPLFTSGLVNTFKYKSLSLSFLWDLRWGGDVINDTEYENYTREISTKTLDRETPRVITGVLKDGLENTDHPTPNTISLTPYAISNYYTTNVAPEMFVEHNIKALRLRDATLRYNLPQSALHKLGFVKSLAVTFTVTDAVLITNYSGTDPESNATNASSGGIGGYGIDYGNVGKPIGFNLGFTVKL